MGLSHFSDVFSAIRLTSLVYQLSHYPLEQASIDAIQGAAVCHEFDINENQAIKINFINIIIIDSAIEKIQREREKERVRGSESENLFDVLAKVH